VTTYDERLWPPLWLWAVVGGLALSFALAIHASVGKIWVTLLVLVPAAAAAWGLVRAAARVRVHDGRLTAGDAAIPVRLLGPVEVLDAEQARAVRGPESDPAGYHLIRGWVPAGVRAAVEDPGDPTPYWFVASRHPAALAAAIEQARSQ